MLHFLFNHSENGIDTTIAPGNTFSDVWVFLPLKASPYRIRSIMVTRVQADSGLLFPSVEGGVQLNYFPFQQLAQQATVDTPGGGFLQQGASVFADKHQAWHGCLQMDAGSTVALSFRYWNLPVAAAVNVQMSVTILVE